MTTKAIEAGARAMIHHRHWSSFWSSEEARELAEACIEAAIASGALVPASAVAAERERCAAIIDSYAQPDRFKPSEQWKEDMTVAEVYETGVIDAMGWAAKEVRALSPEPASGEFVVVPRADLQVVVDIAGRNESAIEIECIKEWLKDAATKDGSGA